MNTEKKMQEQSEAEDLSADLDARFMELSNQLSIVQRYAVIVSLILSAATNGCKGVNDDE